MSSIEGRRYGRWFVVRTNRDHCLCRCDCGSVKAVSRRNLLADGTKSCGCLRRELLTSHGLARSAENLAWRNMRARCQNPKRRDYARYGGRGITVTPEWEDFSAFIADMGRRPSREHSIERVDNDAGYSAANCRWATRSEQNRNKRGVRLFVVDNARRSLSELADAIGITANSLSYRIKAHGLEKALTMKKAGK